MRRHPTTGRHGLPPRFGRVVVVSMLAGLAGLTGAERVARASDESLAVLGIEANEVGDALGTQVTEALRRRAAEATGLRLVPGKDLIELKMIFGCDSEAPACLAQSGRSLGADRLLYGSLRKAEGGKSIAISLKLLDVRDSIIVKQVNETVPKRTLTSAAIPGMASRWFAQLVVPPQAGVIAVQSQPPDAFVSIDGAAVGRTPIKVKEQRPGPHTVIVQLDGHVTSTQTVEVSAGAVETLVVRLERDLRVEPARPPTIGVTEPPPTNTLTQEPPKPRHPGRGAKIAAIGLVAGAVVSGAVAIYTWRSYLSLESSAQSNLGLLAPPSSGDKNVRDYFAKPSCTTPPVPDSTTTRNYLSECSSGNKYANATTGLWVTAGVLAAAGVVSFVIGDRLDAKAERERREGRASVPSIRQSLRLLPAISTQGGGLQASFEF